jgi:opacity protein-like surface antigen
MNTKLILSSLCVAAVLAVTLSTSAMAQDATQATNNCAATDKIDGSTANDARQKMEAAGYSDVTALYKGCDNVWHGQARANGNAVNVMVGPDGVVRQEGS